MASLVLLALLVEEYICTKTSCMRICEAVNKALHVDCCAVFIIVLVTVIF